jgi:ribosomal protein L7/L12
MITHAEARQLVASKVSSRVEGLCADDEIIVIDDATIEKSWGWVFFYTSRKWLETQDVRYALAGNAPLIVERADGNILSTGTAHTIDYYVANYERCGNPNAVERPEVQVNGWRLGASSVSAINVLRQHARLGLGDAKRIVDDCLANRSSVVITPSVQEARNLVASLGSVGFIAEVRYDGKGDIRDNREIES